MAMGMLGPLTSGMNAGGATRRSGEGRRARWTRRRSRRPTPRPAEAVAAARRSRRRQAASCRASPGPPAASTRRDRRSCRRAGRRAPAAHPRSATSARPREHGGRRALRGTAAAYGARRTWQGSRRGQTDAVDGRPSHRERRSRPEIGAETTARSGISSKESGQPDKRKEEIRGRQHSRWRGQIARRSNTTRSAPRARQADA